MTFKERKSLFKFYFYNCVNIDDLIFIIVYTIIYIYIEKNKLMYVFNYFIS